MLNDDCISTRCSERLTKNAEYRKFNQELIMAYHDIVPILRKQGYDIDRLTNAVYGLETCIQDECYKIGYEDGKSDQHI